MATTAEASHGSIPEIARLALDRLYNELSHKRGQIDRVSRTASGILLAAAGWVALKTTPLPTRSALLLVAFTFAVMVGGTWVLFINGSRYVEIESAIRAVHRYLGLHTESALIPAATVFPQRWLRTRSPAQVVWHHWALIWSIGGFCMAAVLTS